MTSDVSQLSDQDLQSLYQKNTAQPTQPTNDSRGTSDVSHLSDAQLQMEYNKSQNKPDSMTNMGPVNYVEQHPVKTLLQPAAQTITGKSIEDFANEQMSGRPATGMDNPFTYAATTAAQATAGTAGGIADALTSPVNAVLGPLAKGAATAIGHGIEMLPTGMRDASARLYDWMVRLPTKAFNYSKDPLDVLQKEQLPGNSITDIAQHAQDRLEQRSAELNDAVKNSKNTINASEIINQHLEDAASKAQGSLQDRTATLNKIQTMSDKINKNYGNLYNMPVQDAIKLKRQLADDFPFVKGDSDGNILANAAHKMYHDLNGEVDKVEPDIVELNHRVSGLIDISKAATNRMAVESRNNPLGIIATMIGIGTAAGGGDFAMHRNPAEAIGAGISAALMSKAMTSPAVLTRVATTLSNMADVDKINLFKAAPWFMDIATKASDFINGKAPVESLDAQVVPKGTIPNTGEPNTRFIPNTQPSLPDQSNKPSGLIPKFMQEGIGQKPALEPRTGPKYPAQDPTVNESGLPLVNKSISLRGPVQSSTEDLSTTPKTSTYNGPLQPNIRAQSDMSKGGSDVATRTAMAVGGGSALVAKPEDQERFKMAPAAYTKNEEGFDKTVRMDSDKKSRVVGYGFNSNNPSVWKMIPQDVINGHRELTTQEADAIYPKAYNIARNNAIQFAGNNAWNTMSPKQQQSITDMSYQMGIHKLKGFVNLRSAIQSGNWSQASQEILKSKYATQVPDRARRASMLMSRNQ